MVHARALFIYFVARVVIYVTHVPVVDGLKSLGLRQSRAAETLPRDLASGLVKSKADRIAREFVR